MHSKESEANSLPVIEFSISARGTQYYSGDKTKVETWYGDIHQIAWSGVSTVQVMGYTLDMGKIYESTTLVDIGNEPIEEDYQCWSTRFRRQRGVKFSPRDPFRFIGIENLLRRS